MAVAVEQKQRIRELKYRYGRYTDTADVDAFVELFTEDAEFDIGVYGTGSGHDELEEFIEWVAEQNVVNRVHNIFNPLITVDGETATGEWYYIALYEQDDGTVEIGQGYYDDEYRLVDGEWKISSLTAKRIITREL